MKHSLLLKIVCGVVGVSVHPLSSSRPLLSSFSGKDGDLAGFGQRVNDLGLVVGIVDPRLAELSRIAVLFPVVVPVSSAIGAEAKYIHLHR